MTPRGSKRGSYQSESSSPWPSDCICACSDPKPRKSAFPKRRTLCSGVTLMPTTTWSYIRSASSSTLSVSPDSLFETPGVGALGVSFWLAIVVPAPGDYFQRRPAPRKPMEAGPTLGSGVARTHKRFISMERLRVCIPYAQSSALRALIDAQGPQTLGPLNSPLNFTGNEPTHLSESQVICIRNPPPRRDWSEKKARLLRFYRSID